MAISGLAVCPFCGENGYQKDGNPYENLFISSSNWRTTSNSNNIVLKGLWSLGCKDCGITLSKEAIYTISFEDGTVVNNQGREDLIDKWNGDRLEEETEQTPA